MLYRSPLPTRLPPPYECVKYLPEHGQVSALTPVKIVVVCWNRKWLYVVGQYGTIDVPPAAPLLNISVEMAYNNTGTYILIPADDIALLAVTCIQIAAITGALCRRVESRYYAFIDWPGAASPPPFVGPLTDIINFCRSLARINPSSPLDRCRSRINGHGSIKGRSNLNVFSTTNDIIICSE